MKLEQKIRRAETKKGAEVKTLKHKKGAKVDKAAVQTVEDKRSEIKKLIGMLAAGGAFFAFLALHDPHNPGATEPITDRTEMTPPKAPEKNIEPRVKATPIAPFVPEGADETERMIALQKYWKTISLDALKLFKDADPIMPRLIEFMERNAFYSLPMGPVSTINVTPPGAKEVAFPDEKNNTFEVVFMPEKYARYMKSSIITEVGGRVMRIAATFKSKEWLGIMLAHELSHIYNMQVLNEDATKHGQYIAGEVKAHTLEMHLLRSWNPTAYDEMIKKSLQYFGKGNKLKMDDLVDSTYPLRQPLVGKNEGELGFASVQLAILFEEARKSGATDKDLERVYERYTQHFYR